MNLLNRQSDFAKSVLQDEHVGSLSTLGMGVEKGLDVYRNNLKIAWKNALKGTFPVLTQLLGNDGMSLLSRDYLKSHPSLSGDLNDLGSEISDFLKNYAPLADYPYLADVALLEWHVHKVHSVANHRSFQVSDLMAHGVDEWLAAKVEFAPSAVLLTSSTAAASIWLAHQPNGDLSSLQDDGLIASHEYILISRPLWRVEVRVLDSGAYHFLSQLQKAVSFEQAFENLESQNIEFDFAPSLPLFIEAGIWAKMLF